MQLRDRAATQGILLLESDIKPADRYLMERFITAPMLVSGEARAKSDYLVLASPQIKSGEYLPDFSYLSLDIETDGIDGEILSIAFCGRVHNLHHEEILMQGEEKQWPCDLPLLWFASEAALLKGFLHRFQQLDPDLILGWNLINFDLNILEQRCRRHRIPFNLGRGNSSAAVLQPKQPGQLRIATVPGRVALDVSIPACRLLVI